MRAIPALVRTSEFACAINFAKPIFDAWKEPTSLARLAFDALEPWSVTLDAMSFEPSPASLSDVQLAVHLPAANASVLMRLDGIKVVAREFEWSAFDEVSRIMEAIATIVTDAPVDVRSGRQDKHSAVRALHLTPIGRDLAAVTGSLLAKRTLDGAAPPVACGLSIHWPSAEWTIDKSMLHSSSLFVRIAADGMEDERTAALGARVRNDEERLMTALALAPSRDQGAPQ